MKNSHQFGGKVILLGGDFRQTLPVVPKGSKVDIIESSIKSSYLWIHFKIIHLIDNMRISSDQVDYNAWLLKIGDGLSRSNSDLPTNSVEIPPYFLENDSLIKCVYGNSIEIADIDSLSTKIILTTKNKIALTLNNDIINIISGPIKHYYSADSIERDNKDDMMNFPLEFLHSQTPSGMPPHKLTLKVGTIVMLLRNLSPKKGLCNGTRLIIRHLHINFIDAEVLTGTNKGYRVFLPRIDLAPSDSQLPFTLKRRQFPIIPAFVITINKSQGQTFDHVGLFLPEPVFAHGQLYVALTRYIEAYDGIDNDNGPGAIFTNCEKGPHFCYKYFFGVNVVDSMRRDVKDQCYSVVEWWICRTSVDSDDNTHENELTTKLMIDLLYIPKLLTCEDNQEAVGGLSILHSWIPESSNNSEKISDED
ncbi:uncharacterized protein LOC135926847 [Gordionus sp. m RMFG-2023]|uniref:uncharacterized protein LOC135926847 n=1 Tax=Gordionus sp. m RMFG-2023 TaxID=3053472 RepID=UPI0031FDF448